MTAQDKLAELDREFHGPDSTMHMDHYRERRAELVREAASEERAPNAEAPAAPNVVTRAQLEYVLMAVADAVRAEFRKRDARLAELEAKPNIAVSASGDLRVDGMAHFVRVVDALQRTLTKPMRPIYDDVGKLIGAKRDD